jgi:hypothetical protein
VSEFGVKIQTGSGIHVDFFLLPTFAELTDTSNPLPHFPAFSVLTQAADEFVGKYCKSMTVGKHSFSGFELSKVGAGTKLKTEVVLAIVEKASAGYRKALFENYTAFNRGPQRSIIFLMMLHDLRHRGWDPSAFTPAEAGMLYTNLERSYQTPKVIELYAQQCFGNQVVLPIDNWVEAFLRWPLNFRPTKKKAHYAELFATTSIWGKLERVIWIAAQARKVHSSVCKDILWCIRYGASITKKGKTTWILRGAGPLTCKICETHIRNVCPSYAAIANKSVGFNGADPSATFDIATSAGNNTVGGQTLESCESKSMRTKDNYSTHDRPDKFKPYPQLGHAGTVLTTKDFIQKY